MVELTGVIVYPFTLTCAMILAGALKYGGPAVVLKDAKSTVEYASVSLISETSLFIEFSGHSLQGRLLYAENATMGTFISLKINRPGTLRFEMKLTATNRSHQFVILSAPLDRTADQWHSADLRISLREKVVILFVDGKNAYPTHIEDVAANTARYSFGGYLHVGRLPPNLLADASKVVHFTAVMEFAFVGNIKSIFVNGRAPLPLKALNGAEIAPGLSHCHLLSREVARGGDSHWLCPQNLSCLDGLDGPKCGCNKNSRELGICQFQSSGAKNEAFIVLLLNGSIHFRLWSPRLQKNAIIQKRQDCNSPYSTCSDGTWHHLSFSYSPLRIQTEVDGDRQTFEIPKNQLRLQFKALYFGSLAPKVQERLQLQNIRNFIGCFKHIFYRSRKDFVDLIDLVKDNSTKQRQETEIGEIKCKAAAFQTCTVARKAKRDAVSHHSAITFVRPGGYLRSQQGWRTVSAGNITFKIRTLKTNCLLLFSSSGWPKSEKKHVFPRDEPFHPVNPIDRLTGTDIFSAELREGYLVFLLNTGSGINEFATENIWRGDQGRSGWFVADGITHYVEIHLTNGSLSVTMDGHTLSMRPRTKPKYTILNLNGYLYVGGLPEELRDETPPQAWSARLREDFVGCLGALSVDGESLDLGLEVTARWAKGYVRLGESDLKGLSNMCTAQENPCGSGKCVQGSWSEPLCDCTQTNFVKNQCKEDIKDNATVLDSDYNCIGVLAEDVSVYNTELETDAFIGRLSQFKLNGLDIIKIINEVANYRSKESSYGSYDPGLLTLVDNWKDSIEITASTAKDERIRTFPLHFNGDGGLMEYTLRLEACLSIRLSLKTSMVQVCTIGTFTLDIELDGEKLTPLGLPEGQATASRHAFERLFLGGLPIEGAGKFRNRFRSTHEYDGCLADVEIVQKSVKSSLVIESNAFHPPKNPLRTAKYAKGVKLGCHLNEQSSSEGAWKTGSSPSQCRPGVCGFGGRCVQQLDTYFCDCIMSGFRGQVCTDGSSGSHFNEVHQVYVGCDPTLISASVANYVGPTFVGHISGVNVNGVFLADLLMGEIISGIFYKDGKDILIDPTFTPKVRQIANLSMTQHHQAPAIADTSSADIGGKLYPSESKEIFPPWSHDRAPQDDANRLNGVDNSASLEQLSEAEKNGQVEITSFLPSLNTWLLLAGFGTTLLLIALIIGYVVHKFRRRNEGSYNKQQPN
ncbi:Neurexin-1-alpha [Echinococcus granulosus]|uniref:Neurexin-1-alpha n=1 Tax=Echinococcus granulosus TaxID=6210 RepID=W6UNY1_ECHGR|nr:Neurexin-1-alpha [Echinococcus granulosus]EUB63390.1 Neurexin-1-alpha [Echinococcus granulosus]